MELPTINSRIRFIKRLYSHSSKSTNWKAVVGLEIHAQISSSSKLFSGSSTKFSSPVNTNVSLFDCATPGTLPVLNKKCVEAGVLTALALNCKVNPVSMFDRKHYFYADLPAGYQITQQRAPLAVNGELEFDVFTPGIHKKPYKAKAHIKQLQLEQDSGKSLHDSTRSLVDLNRAGAPLMELVFEPDLCDGEEAAGLVKELSTILRRIGTCSCKMEEGALRVDANVSIHKRGEELGTRTEVKNIGSVRGVAAAVKYEIERQIKLKESGETIINETRAWDAVSKATVPMRDKEEKQDYRYMPEPNLPPLHIAMGFVDQGCVNADKLKESLPELPEETRKRLKEELNLTPEQVIILVNDELLLNLFEDTRKVEGIQPKLLANIIINDFSTILNKNDVESSDLNLNPTSFAEIVKMLQDKVISRQTVKLLLNEIVLGNTANPTKIVQERNLLQITDEKLLEKMCQEVLDEKPDAVKQYKNGKTKVLKAFLGAVSDRSEQKADMARVEMILKRLLNK